MADLTGITVDPEEVEGYSEHKEHLFCSAKVCPCKEDQDRVNELNGHVQDGLASVDDANRIYRGQTV